MMIIVKNCIFLFKLVNNYHKFLNEIGHVIIRESSEINSLVVELEKVVE